MIASRILTHYAKRWETGVIVQSIYLHYDKVGWAFNRSPNKDLFNMANKKDYFEEFMVASEHKKPSQIYYAKRRAGIILKATKNTSFWGKMIISQNEKMEFLTTAVLTRSSFIHNIRVPFLSGEKLKETRRLLMTDKIGAIEAEFTRARTQNFIKALRDSGIGETETLSNGEIIDTPLKAYRLWQKGEIDTETYLAMIDFWKTHTEYKDDNKHLRYAD